MPVVFEPGSILSSIAWLTTSEHDLFKMIVKGYLLNKAAFPESNHFLATEG
jgi:hypothetical protein